MSQPERVAPSSQDASSDNEGTHDISAHIESNTVDHSPVAQRLEEVRLAPPTHEGDIGKLGRYRVLKQLGRGGMGAVYLGHDEVLQRKVAIKILLPGVAIDSTARDRFLREAQTAARVKSDHVVTIYDVGQENGVPFLAMEYLQGYPLDQYLRQKGNLGIDQAIRIGRETARGLAAAHEWGLVHRDIKPGNLWLEAPNGRVKILDFGLARQEQDDVHLTNSGAILGTPAYMSPEQADGQKVDGRSDLFSLGGVLYRLTTGELPFPGSSTMAVLKSLAVKEPIPVRQHNPQVPESLAKLIHRLLAKSLEERYQSAQEVVEALDQLGAVGAGTKSVVVKVEPLNVSVQTEDVWSGIDDEPSQTAEPVSSPKTAKGKTALPWLWLVGGLGVFAALVMLIVISIKTPKGTLVIESDDENVEILVKQNGAIIKDKTKDREIELNVGDYTIEVSEKKEGLKLSTDRFSIKRDGTETVRVRLEKPKDVAKKSEPAQKELLSSKGRTEADYQRRVAEWVFKQPGKNFGYDGWRNEWFSEIERLPKGPLSLSQATFRSLPNSRELDLTPLLGCGSLYQLNVEDCDFDDEDFERNFLALSDTNLTHIHFIRTAITPKSIRKLEAIPRITNLKLEGNKHLPASTYALLAKNPNLTQLSLLDDPTDEDLAPLLESGRLESLYLRGGSFTSRTLALVAMNTNLSSLYLQSVSVGDDDLTPLAKLRELQGLDLRGSKVTLEGARKFADQVPWCAIWLDGKSIERPIPNAAAERRVAEKLKPYFASMTLRLPDAKTVSVKKEEPLPKHDFAVTQLIGDRSPNPKGFVSETLLPALSESSHLEFFRVGDDLNWTQADFAKLASFPFRERLWGFESPIPLSEANLAMMQKFPRLIQFVARSESITDEQITALSKLSRLRTIYFRNFNHENRLTARGWEAFGRLPTIVLQFDTPKNLGPDAFRAFAKMPRLRSLYLSDISIPGTDLAPLAESRTLKRLVITVGNDGLKSLGTFSRLEYLEVHNKATTDAGLTHLEGLKKLRGLNLKATAVTEQGVLRLAQNLPWCRIEWEGGVIQWGW